MVINSAIGFIKRQKTAFRWIYFVSVFGFWVSGASVAVAQETDSTAIVSDSVMVAEKWLPDPKKAVKYSLMLPGAGQIYNRHWWKAPFVWGALGGTIFVVDYNQTRYRDFRDALNASLAGKEHKYTGTLIDNETALRARRDQFDKNTQQAYFLIVAVYAAQAIEAFTDAHLQDFDISDDFSLRLGLPTPEPGQMPVAGLALTFSLNTKK